MKAIMYHYVRPPDPDVPYFSFLHLDDFRRQLDWFDREFGFVAQADFLSSFDGGTCPSSGVVLTFDDGLTDHAEWVVPELVARNLWGIFYVPVGPYMTGKLLDVHRIHVLLGRLGPHIALTSLVDLIDDSMLADAHVEEFHKLTYRYQDGAVEAKKFKRILNYFIGYQHRTSVIDELMERHLDREPEVDSYYISPSRLKELPAQGMIVGSHSVTHRVLSRLPPEVQRKELATAFAFLEDLLPGQPRTFCYPYGGDHTFTAETEKFLDDLGCMFSFSVEHRDIAPADVAVRPNALPRYDCNRFPFGQIYLAS